MKWRLSVKGRKPPTATRSYTRSIAEVAQPSAMP
jgi:hypothetical protein